MNWATAKDLKAQLLRHWERGSLLHPLVFDETCFPLRLTLKRPGSAELTTQFETVGAWISQLKAIPYIRIEWRDVRHPVMGAQQLPESIWIDTLDAAVTWLNKCAEAERFKSMVVQTRSRYPLLLTWLAKRPLQAIDLAEQWPQLLNVVDWMQQHPRPGCYLRQVDVPGVHSKFIERNKSVLTELFDLALPVEFIAEEYKGANQFSARYGFSNKPVRIRFRVLDENIDLLSGVIKPDITLDMESFASLNVAVQRVFITENEINFLAFPPADNAIVIFGAGYGWDALARAHWLNHCQLYYWGDIDTHGFGILDQLRSKFAHVESFLMDRLTLMAHQSLWDHEEKQLVNDLPRLSVVERVLFDDLRDNRIRKGLRLEQERIGFKWLQEALENL